MDGRNRNNMTLQQRQAISRKLRKRRPKTKALDRLEAAKNVLRRTGLEVYSAVIDDPRAKGYIRVGPRKFKPAEVIRQAAEILQREATRQRELRTLYGLSPKRR